MPTASPASDHARGHVAPQSPDVLQGPGVTVLMPVHKHGAYLDAAIASILQQTYADFEFIIVDDGLADEARARLHAWPTKDARIRILANPGQGISAALNHGLAAACGAIIVRMGADDIAAPHRIARQVAFLQDHPEIAAVGSAVRFIDDAGTPTIERGYPQTPDAALTVLSAGKSPMAHPAVAMRRDVIRSIGGYRPLFDGAEDFDLWVRLTEHHPIANLPETLLDYRLHGGNTTFVPCWEQALAAHLARLSGQARRSGAPDPLENASQLELHQLLQLEPTPAARTKMLVELAEAALLSFQTQNQGIYLDHARACLFALDTLTSERARRASRTLIWHLWGNGARARAAEVGAWMVRRRVPMALFNTGAAEGPETAYAGNRQISAWLVHCADPSNAGRRAPSGTLTPAQVQQLVEEAEAHGVLPAVMRNLPDFTQHESYAAARADGLARQRVGLSFSAMLRHYGEAIRTAAADLPAVVVKGPAFARLLYPDPRLRPFTDIDLLVAPAAVPAVNAILDAQSFKFLADDFDPQRQEAKWVHRGTPLLMVEVQTNLVHHPKLRASLSLAYEDIADGPESPAALLTIATFHGALHRFERLRQVVDICQAARNLTQPGDEAHFATLLERTGGRFAAIASLDLAYRLFAEPRCHEIAKELGSFRHRVLTRMLVDRSAVLSTMNSTRFYHSWRRQMFRLLLQRSHQF